MPLIDSMGRLPGYRHIKGEMVKRSEIRSATQTLLKLQIDEYLQKHLYGNPRYDDPKRLGRSEYSVFSQFGEDGILAEIFRRIGGSAGGFVEIGAGDGVENNTAYLLTKGWSGLWVEGNPRGVQKIRSRFDALLRPGTLRIKESFVTAENVGPLLRSESVPEEFDLLSLDVDYNTYWIWKALGSFRPRVVVVEYNAAFPPADSWIVRYDAAAAWDGSSHQGASLRALFELGELRGYKLVGCCFAGSNAFFVREDLVADKFAAPFTPENHYEPPRYFLYTDRGHRRGWGEFVAGDPDPK